jgi:hypothetical protein
VQICLAHPSSLHPGCSFSGLDNDPDLNFSSTPFQPTYKWLRECSLLFILPVLGGAIT